jgi:sulfide:quinone oxidoreductase
LELLGPRAVASISRELESAGIAVESATRIDVEGGHAQTVLLQPSGRRIEVERMLAPPALRGRPIAGIPTDADGFIEVDEHCRVRGVQGVWAAGDGTSFPLKSSDARTDLPGPGPRSGGGAAN